MPTTDAHPSLPLPEDSATLRRALGLIEVVGLLGFYATFLIPAVQAVLQRGDVGALLLVLSESLVVALMLFRNRAQTLSLRFGDWALAFGATVAPTLFRPVAADPSWLTHTATLVMMVGLCFQVYAKFILGRRFGVVAAHRGICAAGPYRFVRHPIYVGYSITYLGFMLSSFSWWNLAVYALIYSLMIPRIFAEERLLRRDPAYDAYCGQVRSRLLPGIL